MTNILHSEPVFRSLESDISRQIVLHQNLPMDFEIRIFASRTQYI